MKRIKEDLAEILKNQQFLFFWNSQVVLQIIIELKQQKSRPMNQSDGTLKGQDKLKSQDYDESYSEIPKNKYHVKLRAKKQNDKAKLKVQEKKKKFSYKKVLNYQQKMNFPLQNNIVFNFYEHVWINQATLREKERAEEGFLKTMFYFKAIKRVQIKQNSHLNIYLKSNQENIYPIEFIIERFKSFGDQTFFRIANRMESIHLQFKELERTDPAEQINNQSLQFHLEQVLRSKKGKKYIIRDKSLDLMIFSKELLQLQGKTMEQTAIQAIKFRSLRDQFTHPLNYVNQVERNFDLMELKLKLMLKEMSLEEYLTSSKASFMDFLTQNHNQIKATVNSQMISSDISYYEIIQILSSKATQQTRQTVPQKLTKSQILFLEDKIAKNFHTLSHLTTVPLNILPENQYRCCTYKVIRQNSVKEKSKKKSKI